MKKYLLLFSLFIVCFSSCRKAAVFNPSAELAAEDVIIKQYILDNNITAIKDPSGLYYQVLSPGTGPHPTITSNVTVSYTGKLLDGITVFETGPSSYFPLVNVTPAWQIGLTHIGAGGSIILIAPSALAYGITGTGSVAANTPVTWTIGLQGFN